MGTPYKGQLYPAKEHYSDSTVALFIPHGFRETASVDFVVRFHGSTNAVAGTLTTFHLVEQLVASGRNAILVIPEGPHDAPDSFGGKLEDPDGFKRFMAEVVATLRARAEFKDQRRLRRPHHPLRPQWRLPRHRRHPRPRRAAKNADEVWLFDALYGRTNSFLAWADRSHGRLLNIYTDHGGTEEMPKNSKPASGPAPRRFSPSRKPPSLPTRSDKTNSSSSTPTSPTTRSQIGATNSPSSLRPASSPTVESGRFGPA